MADIEIESFKGQQLEPLKPASEQVLPPEVIQTLGAGIDGMRLRFGDEAAADIQRNYPWQLVVLDKKQYPPWLAGILIMGTPEQEIDKDHTGTFIFHSQPDDGYKIYITIPPQSPAMSGSFLPSPSNLETSAVSNRVGIEDKTEQTTSGSSSHVPISMKPETYKMLKDQERENQDMKKRRIIIDGAVLIVFTPEGSNQLIEKHDEDDNFTLPTDFLYVTAAHFQPELL